MAKTPGKASRMKRLARAACCSLKPRAIRAVSLGAKTIPATHVTPSATAARVRTLLPNAHASSSPTSATRSLKTGTTTGMKTFRQAVWRRKMTVSLTKR